jgi:hypothetical protein
MLLIFFIISVWAFMLMNDWWDFFGVKRLFVASIGVKLP